jgi:uncharacterized cupin superfamily protein
MKQITPLALMWSQYQPEQRRDAHGYFLRDATGAAGVLVDPVALHPGDDAELRELGGVAAVLLTGAARAREALDCTRTFGCRLLAPRWALDRPELRQAEPLDAPAALPAGVERVTLPGQAIPGEAAAQGVAFFQPQSGMLVVGPAVVGVPAGQLSLADHGDRDTNAESRARAARGLRALLACRRASYLLLAEGHSPLKDPARAIQDLIYQHDPAAFLLRPDELAWDAPRATGRRYSIRSAEYSRLLGLTTLDFELSEIAPGCENYPLHRHDGTEELFIVLEGEGEVRTEQGTVQIRAGDVLGFPPRYRVAHAIRNTGERAMRLLSFGAPAERLDMIDYPESGQRAESFHGRGRRFFLPERVNVGYWENTPTD